MLKVLSRLIAPKNKAGCDDCAKREKYTLLNAAADTLKGDFATESVRSGRLEICKKCEYLAMGSNCKLCGCFVHIKARYAAASCDINRW